jgi:hypothetical protein
MLFTFERHVTLTKGAYFCKTGLLPYIISGCKGNKCVSFPLIRHIMTARTKLISMSLARHPVSALLSNKNLSPQKLNTVYTCHFPQYCRTPNQMVLSTTVIQYMELLVWRRHSWCSTSSHHQCMVTFYESQKFLLWQQSGCSMVITCLYLV